MVQRIGAVGDSGVAKHADGDHLLIEMQGLIVCRDQKCHLLIPGGDIAGGGHIDKQRRQHVFQAVLVAPVDRIGPCILKLLELLNIRRRR